MDEQNSGNGAQDNQVIFIDKFRQVITSGRFKFSDGAKKENNQDNAES